jgi:hypothetical protein
MQSSLPVTKYLESEQKATDIIPLVASFISSKSLN